MFQSDEQIEQEFIQLVLKKFPNMQLGCRMELPVMAVCEGEAAESDDAALQDGGVLAIAAQSMIFRLPILEENFQDFNIEGKYLHIYYCGIRNRDHLNMLSENLGSMIPSIDPLTFEIQEVVVTQSMIDHWNTALVRFAISS